MSITWEVKEALENESDSNGFQIKNKTIKRMCYEKKIVFVYFETTFSHLQIACKFPKELQRNSR